MKKSILIALISFFFLLNADAQKIDSTVTGITACKIQPIKGNFTDTTMSVYLGIRIIADNLKDNATLYWMLMDSTQRKTLDGNYTVTGTEYTQWCTNGYDCNLWLFFIVGRFYKFTFVN